MNQFDEIVTRFRQTLDFEHGDKWDLVFTERASVVLAENTPERGKEYEEYEREHQDN